MSARLLAAGADPTEANRRAYRELLVTTPGLAGAVSGVILCDETLRQRVADGRIFPEAMTELGLLVGIKVDTGTRPLAGATGEAVTEGLDGLRERLAEYVTLGARFAKWRAVFSIGNGRPSTRCRRANSHALARYAALCQEAGLVPIVEPEILMHGNHPTAACAAATATVLRDVLADLDLFDVRPQEMVLKPNMVLPGAASTEIATPDQVARSTVTTLRCVLPDTLAGVAFLSGGQRPQRATANLAAMQACAAPWPLTFSFGRALVDPALTTWRGDPSRATAAQQALAHRVRCNAAARAGRYTRALEHTHP
jgi:fructose-bisphosphate aldolase class I